MVLPAICEVASPSPQNIICTECGLIRSVHSTMKVIVGHLHIFFTKETLRTIFDETARILNSWPLCPSSVDTNDWDPIITPSHLL